MSAGFAERNPASHGHTRSVAAPCSADPAPRLRTTWRRPHPGIGGIPMSTRKSLRVLIVGAGTGGLCLAHGLKRAGIDVAVYERDRTRTDGLHGYRVGIDPD